MVRLQFEHVFEFSDGQFVLAGIQSFQSGAVMVLG
jgi:hypothetical protein